MSDGRGLLFSDTPSTNVSQLFVSNTGVYPSQLLQRLVQTKVITSLQPIEPDQFQPASLDLRLGRKAYRVEASFLAGTGRTVMGRVEKLGFQELDLSQGALLEKKAIYLVELQEAVWLPQDLYGVANPKSSTGRLAGR